MKQFRKLVAKNRMHPRMTKLTAAQKKLRAEAAFAASVNHLRGGLETAFNARNVKVEILVADAEIFTLIGSKYYTNHGSSLSLRVTPESVDLYEMSSRCVARYPNTPRHRRKAIDRIVKHDVSELQRITGTACPAKPPNRFLQGARRVNDILFGCLFTP